MISVRSPSTSPVSGSNRVIRSIVSPHHSIRTAVSSYDGMDLEGVALDAELPARAGSTWLRWYWMSTRRCMDHSMSVATPLWTRRIWPSYSSGEPRP